jgi:hypothetical protein
MNRALLAGTTASILGLVGAPAANASTSGKVQLGAQFLYGLGVSDDTYGAYGIGAGLEAGYTIPVGLYLGVAFDYFVGRSSDGYLYDGGNIWTLQAEVGWDFLAGPIVLRPKIGLGVDTLSYELCFIGACVYGDESNFSPAAGLQAIYNFDPIFVDLEVRFTADTGECGIDCSAVTFGVGVGAAL